VQGIIDGKRIVFQIKSLISFLADYDKTINFWIKKFNDDVLNKYGIFSKVLFTSSPYKKTTILPYIIEGKKVSNNIKASYGVLYFDIDLFQYPTFKRVKRVTRKSYLQLRKSNADYKIAVVDIRHEAIKEATAYRNICDNFHNKRYQELSGIILMALDVTRSDCLADTKLIPIKNPYAKTPIDWGSIFKNEIFIIHEGKKYVLNIQTMVHVSKPGWQEWISMEPGYMLMHKGVEFGRL